MVFNCKMCGGNLEITEGMRICKCSYCDSYQTIPDISGEKKLNLFNRANKLRFDCQFDRAYDVYSEIVSIFPDESEAYWGLCLCRYGIEYVTDPDTGKKIPTCHRTSFERIKETSDFMNAIKYADEIMASIYSKEADKIDEIQRKIISVSAKEKPFDIFICYKESDNDIRTKDSFLAEKLYKTLTEKNFKVFFASVTLRDKLGTEFEPYIFSAINSARVMLCVGTSPEHFNAVWVRNEWSRFLDLMRSDKSRVIIPCYSEMGVTSLPDELKGFQAQNLSDENAVGNIVKNIEEIMSANSDTKNQLKNFFEQYELRLKSQMTKLHAYEEQYRKTAIEEKKNAYLLYKKERSEMSGKFIAVAFGELLLWCFITAFMFDKISSPIPWMIITFVMLILTVVFYLPKYLRKLKKADENLARRLSFNENASMDNQAPTENPDYEKFNRAIKHYKIDKLKNLFIAIGTWFLFDLAHIFVVKLFNSIEIAVVFSFSIEWLGTILAIVILCRGNIKAKKNLEKRLIDEEEF